MEGPTLIDQTFKSGSGKFVPSNLQDSLKVALKSIRIGSFGNISCLVYLEELIEIKFQTLFEGIKG